jgi:hypothetical protein
MGAPASERRLRIVRQDTLAVDLRPANGNQGSAARSVARAPEPLRAGETMEEMLDRIEDFDVPATVVCARCGDADCGGCDSELSRSGMIAIVAWERPGAPLLHRLWHTARATTRDPEGFFEALPDGPIAPALRFAIASEIVASTAMVLALLPIVTLIAPHWMKAVALDGPSRSLALRALVLGVPALASLLVIAHAAHGLALDFGARRSGVRSARSRALRFGLYASGWDLVLGPLGAVVILFKEGFGSTLALSRLAVGLPTRSARAFLRGAYGLYGKSADRAVRASYVAAIVSTAVACIAILAGIVALLLA